MLVDQAEVVFVNGPKKGMKNHFFNGHSRITFSDGSQYDYIGGTRYEYNQFRSLRNAARIVENARTQMIRLSYCLSDLEPAIAALQAIRKDLLENE